MNISRFFDFNYFDPGFSKLKSSIRGSLTIFIYFISIIFGLIWFLISWVQPDFKTLFDINTLPVKFLDDSFTINDEFNFDYEISLHPLTNIKRKEDGNCNPFIIFTGPTNHLFNDKMNFTYFPTENKYNIKINFKTDKIKSLLKDLKKTNRESSVFFEIRKNLGNCPNDDSYILKISNKFVNYLDFRDNYSKFLTDNQIGTYLINQEQTLYLTSKSKLSLLYDDIKSVFDGNGDLSSSLKSSIQYNASFKTFKSIAIEITGTEKEIKPLKKQGYTSLAIIQLNISDEFSMKVRCFHNPLLVIPIIFTIISVVNKGFSITSFVWNYRFKYENMINELIYVDTNFEQRLSRLGFDIDLDTFNLKANIKRKDLLFHKKNENEILRKSNDSISRISVESENVMNISENKENKQNSMKFDTKSDKSDDKDKVKNISEGSEITERSNKSRSIFLLKSNQVENINPPVNSEVKLRDNILQFETKVKSKLFSMTEFMRITVFPFYLTPQTKLKFLVFKEALDSLSVDYDRLTSKPFIYKVFKNLLTKENLHLTNEIINFRDTSAYHTFQDNENELQLEFKDDKSSKEDRI